MTALDILCIVLTLAFFGITVAFAYGCDRLMGKSR